MATALSRVSVWLPAPLCLVLLPLGPVSHAATGRDYVALRNRMHCAQDLAYSRLQADAASYVGRVVELRGTVGGTAVCGETVTLMLTMGGQSAVTLEAPAREMRELRDYVNPVVRVLARVAEGASGNEVPLTVLAIAHDSAVTTAEREVAAQEAAATKAASWRAQRRVASYRYSGRRTMQLASRGYFQRSIPAEAVSAVDQLGPRVRSIFPAYYQYIANLNPRLTAFDAAQIALGLLHFADQYDVDPRLVVAMIIAESGFNPNATSRTGAMGLGQLMPGTARELGLSNPYDPIQNLEGSISYLRSRLSNFGYAGSGTMTFEQVAHAMAAYNAGMGAVRKYNGVPPYRETQAYVRRVISTYNQLCQPQ